ncbi:MAG: putative histidine kinase, hybrid, partial [Polaromonas sp.]|nr:putative histidine kinase, hybrid [Polaromonas sp.]
MASFDPMNPLGLPQDEIQSSHTRLRALATHTSAVVWYTSADGSVHLPNPSWEAFTGQSSAQCQGWGWLEAIHPLDRPEVLATWQQVVAANGLMELKYRLRRHDGQYRDVVAQATPVLEGGEVREWVGFCVDVTASKQAGTLLKASEERFRFLDLLGQATRPLTDATQLMAVTARMLGEHLGASRCAYADVETDNDHFTIRNDWSVEGVPSSAGAYSLELFGSEATTRLRLGQHLVVRDVDRELGDDDGGRMFNAIGVKAIICAGLVKEGRLVAMMAVHQTAPRDWTDSDIGVVAEVVDRCWAHIERVRDNAMLREQDRRKDEFIATLAHELRNPLAPMKYALAMMRTSGQPGDGADRARDVIDRQVSLMARLIDDLLDLSRINRGLIELKPAPVQLAELMAQAVETARPAIEGARHRLEVQLPQEPLWLNADAARLVQVIGNLLTNAAKYTPDGGQIRLSARRDGAHAVLQVTDNGVGIPLDQQDKLFRMFTQLRHTADRVQGGLGIGLALVRTLAHLHGGDVSVYSAGLDEGTTFTVELPLFQSAPPGTEAAAEQAAPETGSGTRILVVEDNKDGLETLLELLDAMDYRVAGAGDGLHALDVARSFQPEVVLLDLGLPGMDGYGVARALRADPDLKY